MQKPKLGPFRGKHQKHLSKHHLDSVVAIDLKKPFALFDRRPCVKFVVSVWKSSSEFSLSQQRIDMALVGGSSQDL